VINYGQIKINSSFERMVTLTAKAIARGEPVLLVGETGCGKTTVCQILSQSKSYFYFLNF
jgi:midasin